MSSNPTPAAESTDPDFEPLITFLHSGHASRGLEAAFLCFAKAADIRTLHHVLIMRRHPDRSLAQLAATPGVSWIQALELADRIAAFKTVEERKADEEAQKKKEEKQVAAQKKADETAAASKKKPGAASAVGSAVSASASAAAPQVLRHISDLHAQHSVLDALGDAIDAAAHQISLIPLLLNSTFPLHAGVWKGSHVAAGSAGAAASAAPSSDWPAVLTAQSADLEGRGRLTMTVRASFPSASVVYLRIHQNPTAIVSSLGSLIIGRLMELHGRLPAAMLAHPEFGAAALLTWMEAYATKNKLFNRELSPPLPVTLKQLRNSFAHGEFKVHKGSDGPSVECWNSYADKQAGEPEPLVRFGITMHFEQMRALAWALMNTMHKFREGLLGLSSAEASARAGAGAGASAGAGAGTSAGAQ